MAGNEGIQVYGGAISVEGSLAVGRGASAVSTVQKTLAERGEGELAAALAELGAAIDRDRERLASSELAIAGLQATANELESGRDRSKLRTLLDGLKLAAGTATEVLGAVAGLEHLLF